MRNTSRCGNTKEIRRCLSALPQTTDRPSNTVGLFRAACYLRTCSCIPGGSRACGTWSKRWHSERACDNSRLLSAGRQIWRRRSFHRGGVDFRNTHVSVIPSSSDQQSSKFSDPKRERNRITRRFRWMPGQYCSCIDKRLQRTRCGDILAAVRGYRLSSRPDYQQVGK